MARKEITVTIDAEGRDHGKVFIIREMPSQRGEDWATRFLLALAANGVDVPENFFDMGMAGVAAMGIRAIGGLRWSDAKPLLDEMMSYIRIKPGSTPVVRALNDRGDDGDDIEEIMTRLTLREAWFALHTGFSIADFLSRSRETAERLNGSGDATATSAEALAP